MIIRSTKEQTLLNEGGSILASVLAHVSEMVRPGVTTRELDQIAEHLIIASGGAPAFKGYQPAGTKCSYPATLCTSVNEEIVHAIPSDRVLIEGDIIGLDIGMQYKGFFTDMAVTVPVGGVQSEISSLVHVTKTALEKGIQVIRAGKHIGDIGNAIETFIKPQGYGIVRELVGHGVGKAVHEDPQIPNFGKEHSGPKLVEGMVLAIEPMITLGGENIVLARDGWTWKTADGKSAAHFEHTVIVTRDNPIVVTA